MLGYLRPSSGPWGGWWCREEKGKVAYGGWRRRLRGWGRKGIRNERKRWGRERSLRMNLKIHFPKIIARRVFVKKFKNSILCRVINYNTIPFYK